MPGMTALFDETGARIAKAAFPADVVPDPQMRKLTAPVFKRRPYGDTDSSLDGALLERAYNTGDVIPQSEIDAHYPAATIDTINPNTGPQVGGTVVTITGTNLSGVTGVTFDGVAGTALAIVSQEQLQITSPPHAAGPVDVVLADDSGGVTEVNGFTYV